MNSIIAKNLKTLISEKGLKQNAVAVRAGYSESQFSAIVNGRKTITDEVIFKICSAMDVTPNQLFGITPG